MAYRERRFSCPRCGVQLEGYPRRDKWRCRQCVGVLLGPEEVAADLAMIEWPAGGDEGSRVHLRCPSCLNEMQRFQLLGVELERCVAEHYIWFDSGELGYLRAYIAESADDQPDLARRLLALIDGEGP